MLIAAVLVQIGITHRVDTAPVLFSSDGTRAGYSALMLFTVIYEEVLYRAYLQAKLQSLIGGTALPVIVSAAMFATMHGYPLASTLILFTIGAFYGIVYSMTRELPRLV